MLAHNSASFIATALESVRAQTFQDWELLISDDASTDETESLVGPHLEDPRIRYVLHRENLKQAKNWAFAIENTSAPIITTLHADDAWEPDALQTFVNAFRQQTDLDLAWANWDYYDPGLKIRQRSAPVTIPKEMNGDDACSWLLDNNHALPSASAFTREVAQRAGSPDPRFGMLCDRRYFLQLAMAARRCRAIPKVLVRYRQNEGGVTSVFSSSGRLQEEMIVFANDAENLFRPHPRGGRLAKRLRAGLGKDLFLHGLDAVIGGDRQRGKRWIKNATKLANWSLFEPSSLRGVARTLKGRMIWRMTNWVAFRFDALLYICNIVVANVPSVRLRHLFYRRVMQVEMAPGSFIHSGLWLDCKRHLVIGENSVINQRCRLDARGTLTIGANVSISPEVHIITADHDIAADDLGGRTRAVTIGDYVFVGSRAMILPGVVVGEGAVVAAGAVVTKSVGPREVVAGIPARKIAMRTSQFNYSTKVVRHFF